MPKRREINTILLLTLIGIITGFYLDNRNLNLLPDKLSSLYDDIKSSWLNKEASHKSSDRVERRASINQSNNSTLSTSANIPKNYVPLKHGNYYYCSNDKTPITRKPSQQIYSWVDKDGVRNLSDKKPTRKQAGLKILSLDSIEMDYFDINFYFPEGWLNKDVPNDIRKSAAQFYKILSSLVGLKNLGRSLINVRIYNDRVAYREFEKSVDTDLDESTPGFYNSGSNIAAILNAGNATVTTQIALHEVMHVINHASFGKIPKWINEGMAEYFENYNYKENDNSISPNITWLKLIRDSRNKITLRSIFEDNEQNWMHETRKYYYAYSWSLVYFLMEPKNREYMADFLYELAGDKCDNTDSYSLFENIYPGGVSKLQNDWNRYLVSNIGTQRF